MDNLWLFILWGLPGLGWATVWLKRGVGLSASFLLGQATGYASVLLISLLTAYLPGPFRPALLLLGIGLVLGIALSIAFVSPSSHQLRVDWPRVTPIEGGFLLLLVVIPLFLRFMDLGYAQFQGDEGAAITRAARIMTGSEQDIFLHKKGPGELLIVASTWSLTGTITEWLARLPFAWANVLTVYIVYQIGFLVSGRRSVGFLAAFFLAIEGYLLGFGRIVQYQSVVVLMVSAGVYALLLFRRQKSFVLVYLSATLLACGTLAHYDAGLVFPAILILVGAELLRFKGKDGVSAAPLWPLIGHLFGAGIIAVALLALFYYPFFTNPQAGATSDYLLGRLGGGDQTFNHLPDTLGRTLIYNSIYLLGLAGVGLLLWVGRSWQRWQSWSLFVAVGLFILWGATYFEFESWPGPIWLPFGLLLLFTLLIPKISVEERALWVWFAFPAFFYLYLVALPLTHIYSAIPGLFLISGLGLGYLFDLPTQTQASAVRWASGLGLTLIWGLGAFYAYSLFVDNRPEFLRNKDELPQIVAHPDFPVPEEGLFGFPYQAGWLAANQLFAEGTLTGSYDTNEETDITNYYMHSALRLTCATPDIYIVAENVQDEVAIRDDQLANEYTPTRILTVSGEPKLTVYERNDRIEGDPDGPIVEPSEKYIGEANALMSPAYVARLSGVITNERELPYYDPLEAQMGEFAQLKGFSVDDTNATPGGYVDLTLVWEVVARPGVNYQSFTHLHDGSVMRGQLDGRPQCGNAPTAQWQPGDFVIDPYRIPIQADSPLGPVPLTVGLYDLSTLERVPVMQDGEADNKVDITEIVIE